MLLRRPLERLGTTHGKGVPPYGIVFAVDAVDEADCSNRHGSIENPVLHFLRELFPKLPRWMGGFLL